MIETMRELIERLKVCWYVLTHRNYAFFSCKDSCVEFNEDGQYNGLSDKGLASFSSFSDMWFYTNTGKRTFENVLWETISSFSILMMAKPQKCDE